MPPLIHSPSPIPSPLSETHTSNATQIPSARSAAPSPAPAPAASENDPPAWAKEIINRLAAFDEKLASLEKQNQQPGAPGGLGSGLVPDEMPQMRSSFDLMNDILMNELGGAGFAAPDGQRGFVTPGDFPMPFPLQAMFGGDPGAKLSVMTPTDTIPRQQATADDLLWGSEVELPNTTDTASPPRGPLGGPPTIHVQAPTESKVAKTATRVPSASAQSRASGMRTPRQADIDLGGFVHEHGAVDKDLPPPPGEAAPAWRQSAQAPYPTGPLPAAPHVGSHSPPRQASIERQSEPLTFPIPRLPSGSPPSSHTAAPITAATHATHRDAGHTTHSGPHADTNGPSDTFHTAQSHPPPWDLVQQRLYSWAMIWEEQSFVRCLEDISLGKQVDEIPLSIYVMKTIKR